MPSATTLHAAVILFLSALLMFWAEPLAARLVLPLLGGAPMVWNTAMVFFQGALLAGYLAAHLLARGADGSELGRRDIGLALALIGLAALALPIAIPSFYPPPPADSWPVPWLIGLLGLAVGAPFVALAIVAPLVQCWLARRSASPNVYRLYAASNAGSFAALLAYPFAIEPLFELAIQAQVWAGAYLILLALFATFALALARGTPVLPVVVPSPVAIPSATWKERVGWLVFALVPASLLFGVTLHLTTDIASVPFLWMLPLALYLLSFVVAFSRAGERWQPRLLKLQIPLLILLVLIFAAARAWPQFLIHLAAFFVTATVCHGELFRRRPPAPRLTEFYLWLALGGVLGGVFNVLVAPLLFDGVSEYPIAIAIACLLRPAPTPDAPRIRRIDVFLPAAAGAAYAGALAISTFVPPGLFKSPALLLGLVAAGLLIYACRHKPSRLAIAIGLVLAIGTMTPGAHTTLAQIRTFFGVHRVTVDRDADLRALFHGTTVHGAQFTAKNREQTPLGYYHREGPLGQFFAARGESAPARTAALIGLGAGAAACYRRPNESWTFYEIDPAVERIARRYFTYLAECAPEATVVIGDGRLTLARARDSALDLIVVDAFSSDAVPVHLLTREALAGYLAKLDEAGVILLHLSNRYLDLVPVAAALARDLGLAGRAQTFRPPARGKGAHTHEISASIWVALARSEAALGPLASDPRWTPLAAKPGARAWTDGFSNLAGAIRW